MNFFKINIPLQISKDQFTKQKVTQTFSVLLFQLWVAFFTLLAAFFVYFAIFKFFISKGANDDLWTALERFFRGPILIVLSFVFWRQIGYEVCIRAPFKSFHRKFYSGAAPGINSWQFIAPCLLLWVTEALILKLSFDWVPLFLGEPWSLALKWFLPILSWFFLTHITLHGGTWGFTVVPTTPAAPLADLSK